QALLLDESGLGGSLGIGGGSGTGMGGFGGGGSGWEAWNSSLEKDKCNMLTRNVSINEGSFNGSREQDGSAPSSLENSPRTSMGHPRSALLW
nr:hypothetical protein [Tanacetum cinerariifolium]